MWSKLGEPSQGQASKTQKKRVYETFSTATPKFILSLSKLYMPYHYHGKIVKPSHPVPRPQAWCKRIRGETPLPQAAGSLRTVPGSAARRGRRGRGRGRPGSLGRPSAKQAVVESVHE